MKIYKEYKIIAVAQIYKKNNSRKGNKELCHLLQIPIINLKLNLWIHHQNYSNFKNSLNKNKIIINKTINNSFKFNYNNNNKISKLKQLEILMKIVKICLK